MPPWLKTAPLKDTPKSRSRVSKIGRLSGLFAGAGMSKMCSVRVQNVFFVVPSVSDGGLNLPSQREGATTEQVSKMSRM